MSVYVISNINGNYHEFMFLLQNAKVNLNTDILINLGDMIDFGPNSFEVIRFFKQQMSLFPDHIIPLLGDHEIYAIQRGKNRVKDEVYYSKAIGGKATENSYKISVAFLSDTRWMSTLKLYHVINDYIFFHGGLNLSKLLSKQNISDICFDKNEFFKQDTSVFKNHFIFGHTPTKYINDYYNIKNSEIWIKGNKICINCTYPKEKKMLLYNLTDNIEYYYQFSSKNIYKKKNGVLIK